MKGCFQSQNHNRLFIATNVEEVNFFPQQTNQNIAPKSIQIKLHPLPKSAEYCTPQNDETKIPFLFSTLNTSDTLNVTKSYHYHSTISALLYLIA